MDEIAELMQKGPAFSQDDLLEVKTILALMPTEERFRIIEDVFEGLTLIVSDPDYLGDVELMDLEEFSE